MEMKSYPSQGANNGEIREIWGTTINIAVSSDAFERFFATFVDENDITREPLYGK